MPTSLPARDADTYARIKDAWDRSASSYDRLPGHGLLSHPERQAWSAVLARALGPAPDGGMRILDAGTGTGAMAVLLAEMGHKVTGIDLSAAMLDAARSKARRSGLDVTFLEANAAVLPFDDESFDVVFSRHLFWTLPSPIRTLREWKRVARPGGLVAVADGWWNEPTGTMRRRRAVGAVMRRLLGRGREDHYGYEALHSRLPVSGGVSPYSIRFYFDQAGLSRLTVTDLKHVRAAERRSLPPWYWIDRARYTWLATGRKTD